MREILFRGKRIDNGEWVEGFYSHEKVGDYLTAVFITEMLTDRVVAHHRVDHTTVGQYTGLTDKNGKRIFEGDIVLHDRMLTTGENRKRREQIKRIVHFNRAGWEGMLVGGCSWSLNTLWEGDTYEVIGNIHDNPELLKEETT